MNWGCGWGFGPHMWFGGMHMILFWAAVIVAIVLLVRHRSKTPTGHGAVDEAPLEILRKRYARGEITKEEFDRMKQDLKE
jgi:putative membrane protein